MSDKVLAALRECSGHANTDRIAYLTDLPAENCCNYLTLLKNDMKVKFYNNQWHLNESKYINTNNSIEEQVLDCLGTNKRTVQDIQCILPNVRTAQLESSLAFLEQSGKIKKVTCYQVIKPKAISATTKNPNSTSGKPAQSQASKQYPIQKNKYDGGRFACEDIRYRDSNKVEGNTSSVAWKDSSSGPNTLPGKPQNNFPRMPSGHMPPGHMPPFPPNMDPNGRESFIPLHQRQSVRQNLNQNSMPHPHQFSTQRQPQNPRQRLPGPHQPNLPNNYSNAPYRYPNGQQPNRMLGPRPNSLHNNPFSNTPQVPSGPAMRLPSQGDTPIPPAPGTGDLGPGLGAGIDPYTQMAYGNTYDGYFSGIANPSQEPPSTRSVPPGGRPDERPILDSRGSKNRDDFSRPKRGGRRGAGGRGGISRTVSNSSENEHLLDPACKTNGPPAITEPSPNVSPDLPRDPTDTPTDPTDLTTDPTDPPTDPTDPSKPHILQRPHDRSSEAIIQNLINATNLEKRPQELIDPHILELRNISQELSSVASSQPEELPEILPMTIPNFPLMNSLGDSKLDNQTSSDSDSDMGEIAPLHQLLTSNVSTKIISHQPNYSTESSPPERDIEPPSEKEKKITIREVMRALDHICKNNGHRQPVLLICHRPKNPIIPWRAEITVGKKFSGIGEAAVQSEAVSLAVRQIRDAMNLKRQCRTFIQQTNPLACFLHLMCYKRDYKIPRYDCVINVRGEWSVSAIIRGSNNVKTMDKFTSLDDALKDVFYQACRFLRVPVPGMGPEWDQSVIDYKLVLAAHCPHAMYSVTKVEGWFRATVAIDDNSFTSMKEDKKRWIAEQSAACVACLELELPAFYWEE